jgi:transcriptional regulator with XRE-family HTH domain
LTSSSIVPEGKNRIGPKVRSIRAGIKPKLTLEDLSGRLAVLGVYLDRTTLGRIERSERSVFDYEIIALAKALRVDPIKLLEP